ncbi:MAG: efflux RND transporter periplasmic adaptor subunit, partial [Clostridia bacterium]|nr:efflux RND transporter periplasmic adaptor subunit [Clostridia bacterium]
CLVMAVLLVVILLRPKDPSVGYSEDVAEKRDIVTYNSFVGNVGFTTEMNALSMASAQITEVVVDVGDAVSKGDLIATLDSEMLEKNIEKSELALETQKKANEHSIADAQRAYDNFKYALDNGLNSSLNNVKIQLENAEKNYNTLLDSFNSYLDDMEALISSGYETAASVTVDARKEYRRLLSECDYYEGIIAEYTEKYAEDGLSDAEKDEIGKYELHLGSLKEKAATALDYYKESAKNYADKNDRNFKSIVDNLENALIGLNNAKEGYASAELQIEQQLESYEATIRKLEDTLSLESAEKDLENLKKTLEDYRVVAPCDGIVTSLNLDEGNMTAAGSIAATVSNLEDLEITIKVDEYSILNTKIGKDVVIYIDSIGRTYNGTITWIASNATIANGVSYFEATVEFKADEYVRGGMSVEVRLTKSEALGAVSVVVDAVNYRDDNTAFVYVVGEDGHLVEKNVSLGVSDGIHIEITEGLNEGDKVKYVPSFSLIFPMMGG